VVAGEVLASGGAKSSTFNYSVVPTGEFQAIIVLSETVGPYAQEMEIAGRFSATELHTLKRWKLQPKFFAAELPYAQVMEIGMEVLRTVTQVLRRRPVVIEL
jgi:hypothetical protein